MKPKLVTPTIGLALAVFITPFTSGGDPIPVTVDNFIRAESDLYFTSAFKDGGIGKFFHRREPTPIDKQTVIRINRDTLIHRNR